MLLLVVCLGLGAANPDVAFTVEDGFVTLRLEGRDGPIGDAKIKAYDQVEFVFAEGETDERGIGTFPAPAGGLCRIGITIKGKECDLIPMHIKGNAVEPARVLLTFGTRPCCRVAGVRRTAPDWSPVNEEGVSPPDRTALLVATGGVLVSIAVALIVFIRPWARR